MKRFLVNKDYVIRLDNAQIIAAETIAYEDYVLYIKESCEMCADTILRHVAAIDGYIPHSIYYTLRRKLEDALARMQLNNVTIQISNDICDTCRRKKLKWNSEECFYCAKGNSNYVSGYTLTPGVVKVIVNGPATIIFWTDGTKSIVKCQDDEQFDLEKGIAMCFARKALGNENKYHKHIRKAIKMAEDYIEEHTIDTESKKVNIGQAMDVFAAEANRVIELLFKEKDND